MVLMVSLLIHGLKDKTLVDLFHLNVPEFQVGKVRFPGGKPTQAVGRGAPLSVKTPANTIRTIFKTPQNGVPFPTTLLLIQPPPFPPPKSVHWRTFSCPKIAYFDGITMNYALFENMCRNLRFCAICTIQSYPKRLLLPIGARIWRFYMHSL